MGFLLWRSFSSGRRGSDNDKSARLAGPLPLLLLLLLSTVTQMTDGRHLRPMSQIDDNEIGNGGAIDEGNNILGGAGSKQGAKVTFVNDDDNSFEPASNDVINNKNSDNAVDKPVLGHLRRNWVKISKPPALLNQVTVGDGFELECEAVGEPAPSVQWLKDNLPVIDIDSFERNVIPDQVATGLATVRARLYIPMALKMHEGEFTCVAESGAQIAAATTKLLVVGGAGSFNFTAAAQLYAKEGHFVQSPPRIVLYDHVYMDEIGSDIVLPCKSVGSPRPFVIWLNPAENMIGSDDDRFVVLSDGRLRIRSIRWNDMGLYTCLATNTLGQDNVSTFVYPMRAEK